MFQPWSRSPAKKPCHPSKADRWVPGLDILLFCISVSVFFGGAIMQVAKWGNSLAVRLPAALVQALGIAEGDDVELRPLLKSSKSSKASESAQSPAGGVQVAVVRLPSKSERLQAMQRFRAPWPRDFAFDRDEANQR
jgi:antitoxin MazE